MQKTEQVEREAESKNYHHRKKLVFTLRVTEIVLLVTFKAFLYGRYSFDCIHTSVAYIYSCNCMDYTGA